MQKEREIDAINETNEISTKLLEPHKPIQVKYIDLFCGLGAFHTAFNNINLTQKTTQYTCVLACDVNDKVRSIYEENYGIRPYGDINQINIATIPDFDILCAGFPCQPFSIAGNQKGFQDETRGNLFYKILEIVDEKQPETLILENVKNLHTIHHGETFKTIKQSLVSRGYNVSYKVIDSRYYGCPQSRQRIYIVCCKNTHYTFKNIDAPIVPVSTIIDPTVTDFFDYTDKYFLQPCRGNSMTKYYLINKQTGNGGRQGERVYNIEKCGPTICATSGGPGSKTGLYDFNGKIRKLTVTEALRMFGFDDGYKYDTLTNKNDMLFYLGNSIVVNVLEQIINDLQH